MKPILHNCHVLKWYRWRIWVARQMGRQLRETFLIEMHNQELSNSGWYVE